MVFQGAKKPIRQPRKSAIRKLIFCPQNPDFDQPSAEGAAAPEMADRRRPAMG
jgi:hypothetical protein